ncbi:T9SS type B sorting domain-containing protein [Taibaiella soli]|uniref:PKD domain-containing protein n=1 Tax=Taibaiella soli TaxID=1649169 RepID=A0A2W2BB82_9BACT|nr:gliding motility-associated C-terminal domain-containing protein [Taibaiella soli]PZF70896.1 hypothetical protein DN068_20945 [Taibaiella soli]
MLRSIPIRIKSVLLFLFAAVISFKGKAQCNNWSISTQLVTAATCASNATFSLTVSGPDSANLTNIQYGIPLTNGYSVALNNSPNFGGIPPGTYTVSAVATCGGTQVGKNTTTIVPGNYQPPVATGVASRPSFDCMPTGTLQISVQKGFGPYTFHLTSWPIGYTGQTTVTTTAPTTTFSNVPGGSYTYFCTDACGSSTAPNTYTVTSFAPSSMPLYALNPTVASCDAIRFDLPSTNDNNSFWSGYVSDTSIKVSLSISNNAFNPTPYYGINTGSKYIALNPGFSVKDCYGATIICTFHAPCGPDWQKITSLPYPYVGYYITQACSTFDVDLGAGMLCLPITYTYTNAAGTTFGPFPMGGISAHISNLPAGAYTVTCTSADGATATSSFSSTTIPASPYSVSINNGAVGFNNYINYFKFTASVNVQGRNIQLFSGPPGYYYNYPWYNYPSEILSSNATPALPGTDLFPAGNYVWKITDVCGTYFLPITVGPQDLYQYTAGIDHQKQTCQGLWIWPKGTATTNGTTAPLKFAVYRGSSLGIATELVPGDSLLLTIPGQYTIVPYSSQSSNYNSNFWPGPNAYVNSYTFTYSVNPVQVDMNFTQGFACNAATGQGKIYIQGKNGLPYAGNQYQYYLAHAGNGLTGPYITSNTTGVFTNFGGNANDVYDLKIVDSCGASAVQQIKILDLSIARLASASQYVACQAGTVQLSAIYLPGATYSWTGPNGFTSNLQQPVIQNAGVQNTGVYYVTITTPSCGQSLTDSTILVLNAVPPAPQLTVNCGPPLVLSVSNPAPACQYSWYYKYGTISYYVTWPSDSLNSIHPQIPDGTYRPVAIDSLTGCKTPGLDSFYYSFADSVRILSSRLKICIGDSTTLFAMPITLPSYQWYKDGILIPGATTAIFIANTPGVYKVTAPTSICQSTSSEVTVSNITPPSANLIGSANDVCTGTSVLLQTDTGSGYVYTWIQNGTTAPGVNGNTFTATQTGIYQVTVTNAGCAAVSAPYPVTVHTNPTVALTPSSTQTKCAGDSVYFNTPACTGCTYTWQLNNTAITNAANNTYTAGTTGSYTVTVNSAPCPSVTAPSVNLNVLPAPTATITGATHDICTNASVLLQTDTSMTYSYVWKNNNVAIPGATQSSYNANTNGSYTVTISNGACSTTSAAFVITTHTGPTVNISPATAQTICTGNSINFSTPVCNSCTYTWLQNGTAIPGATANTFIADTTGIYSVVVGNGAICPDVTSVPVPINVLPVPTAIITGTTHDICTNASVLLQTDTSATYSYVWKNNNVAIPGATQSSYSVNATGSYTVTISNGACNTTSAAFVITTHTGPTVNISPATAQTICTGNSVNFSTPVCNSCTYTWLQNGTAIPGATANTFTADTTGTYSVVVGNGAICPDVASVPVPINVLPVPTATITGTTHDICTNASVLLQTDTSATYSYVWKNNNVTIPGATQSSYSVNATGSYTVTASNGACSITSAVFTLTAHAAPIANISPATAQTICTGNSVNFSTPACNSCTYIWLQNGTVIPAATANIYVATTAGTYKVTVGNGSYCPDTTSVSVALTIVPPPTATITGATHDICANDSVLLQTNADPAYTYVWKRDGVVISGATQSTIEANQSGTYTADVANNGCTITSNSYLLTVHPLPTANISPSTPQSICPGGSVTLGTPAVAGYTYVWQHNGTAIPNSNASTYLANDTGSYTVTVSSAYCPSASAGPVTVTLLPNAVHLPNDTLICNQNPFAITLSAGPGFSSYTWSTGATTQQITVTAPNTYWVSATNACGTFTNSMTIHTLADYLLHLPADTVVCNQNGEISLSVGSLYSNVEWSTGATSSSITITQAGTYWVKVETPCGTIYDTTKVSFCRPVVDYMNLPQQIICAGDCIEPTAQASQFPQDYHWYFPGGNPSSANTPIPGTICYANAGTYPVKLVVSNATGSDSMAMQVTVNSKPVSSFKDSTLSIPYNTNIALPPCAAAQKVDWYKDGQLICANCPVLKIDEAKNSNVTYHCVVSNGDCEDSCTYHISVIDIPHDLWLPDVFSPNGDGRNDVFHIITDNPNIRVISLSVFNRWGQRVFVSNLNNDGWDGTFNGKACELDTYYWMIEYTVKGSDETYFKKGDVTLVR